MEVIAISREREKWRAKQKARKKEEMTEAKNAYGNNDPTPFEALRHIVQQERENVE